jgi:phage terminase large subunit-like protein
MSRHGRAIRFMETYCRPPKGRGHGEPMRLAGFQKEELEEILADGVEAAVRAFPRGNGKSTLEAGFCAWAGFDDDYTGSPSVPIIATTVGQAIRSVYGTIVSMVKAEPELAGRALIFTGTGTSRIVVPFIGDGEIFPMANDEAGLQGLDPSVAIADEIGFQPLAAWNSLLLAAGKRERSLVLGMGTPGPSRESALWHLRRLVTTGHRTPGFSFREWMADPGCRIDDRAQWRKANPALRAGFLRSSALETALATAGEAAFRMYRLGQWVDGVAGWLGPDGSTAWEARRRPYAMVPGAPTWVGIDVGIKRDSSAVTHVQYRVDDPGTLHAVTRIWLPTADEPVDVTDIMAYLRELATDYRLGGVSFDPRFFDVPAKMLYDEGLPMIEVPQSVERMTPACGQLYDLIRNGGITHDADLQYTAQVLGAIARLNERGFTLSKGKSRVRIDAAISTALACDRAQHKKKPRSALVLL